MRIPTPKPIAEYLLKDGRVYMEKLGRTYILVRTYHLGGFPEPDVWISRTKHEAEEILSDLLRTDVLDLE